MKQSKESLKVSSWIRFIFSFYFEAAFLFSIHFPTQKDLASLQDTNFGHDAKVIANLGLGISIYDIRSIDDGFIFPSEGASTYTVFYLLLQLIILV